MSVDAFRDRLRRLRGDALSEASVVRETLPESLRRRLGRLGGTAEAAPDTRVGLPRELASYRGPAGQFLARAALLPGSARHGAFRLDEAAAVDSQMFALLTHDRTLAGVDLRRALFLDIETTGLSGGAGIHVFLIGLGHFVGDEFLVWQGFLSEPSQERALLTEVARRVAEADCLVSFFGKSFDRHRLEDKMRIVGVEPPFDARPHLDLYHPLRALTRAALPDQRLGTLEAVLTEVRRDDDLSGAFAPEAWFEFLAGRAHRLEGVFRHNRDDVLSLVTLAAYLGRVGEESRVDGGGLAGCSCTRAAALARAYEAKGERAEAWKWYETAIARASADARRRLELTYADCLRRAGEVEIARRRYIALLEAADDMFTVPACIQFAKLLEHRCHDHEEAKSLCLRALHTVDRFHLGAERAQHRGDLERRLARLQRHRGRGL